MPVRSGKAIISFCGVKIEFLQGKALTRESRCSRQEKPMGGNLATDCGRKNMRLTPFSTALGMSDRNGHEKSHRRKPMARIRLIFPYRRI